MNIGLNVGTSQKTDTIRTHYENDFIKKQENLDPYTLATKLYASINGNRLTSNDKLSQDKIVKLKIAMDYYNEAHKKNIERNNSLKELENETKELFYAVYGKSYEEALNEYKIKGKTM